MKELEQAARLVAESRVAIASTGAGMSRESGIRTFRDAQDGLWAQYDPEQLATRQGFAADPARVWGWYNYRRGLINRAEPHSGHYALARLEQLVPHFVVITQNIDGLHHRAGTSEVLELHGNIHRFKCFEHDHPVEVEIPVGNADGSLEPPKCEQCGSPIRPDVVWFGETLPPEVHQRAEALAAECDVMLVVGTSGFVYPAAALPMVARANGATVIEINTSRSELTSAVDLFCEGEAGRVLPELYGAVEEMLGDGHAG